GDAPPLWALPVRVPAPQYQEADCPADGIGGGSPIAPPSGTGFGTSPRNSEVFKVLSGEVLPQLAAKGTPAAIWSAGCAAGEEAYSLRIAWEELQVKKPYLRLLAADIDAGSLERAAEGCYLKSSLREVPDALQRKYFEQEGELYRVREEVRRSV